MCEPVIALAVISTAAAAYGQYQQGEAASKSARYNAKMEDYNATLADQQAADAKERGNIVGNQIQNDTAKTLAEGNASFAAGNVDLTSGSVKYWQLDTAAGSARDVATAHANAAQEAAGFMAQGWNARASSRLTRAQGRQARTAGAINAGSSLLAGAAQTAYDFRKK